MMTDTSEDQSRRGPDLPTIGSCLGKVESGSIHSNQNLGKKTDHARPLTAVSAVCK